LGGVCFDPTDSSFYAIGFNNLFSLPLHFPAKAWCNEWRQRNYGSNATKTKEYLIGESSLKKVDWHTRAIAEQKQCYDFQFILLHIK
jgi:hypothetical protein